MDDLIAWLRAQIDEDERLARECIAEVGSWRVGRPYPDDYYLPGKPPEPREIADQDAFPHYPYGSCATELAFMAGPGHPDAVLAECEAKRRVIKLYTNALAAHREGSISNRNQIQDEAAVDVLGAAVQAYGVLYAKLGRPGYQESWRPA